MGPPWGAFCQITLTSCFDWSTPLKQQSNGPLYSDTVIGTLGVNGWAVTFGTAGRGLGGCRPAQSIKELSWLFRLTKPVFIFSSATILLGCASPHSTSDMSSKMALDDSDTDCQSCDDLNDAFPAAQVLVNVATSKNYYVYSSQPLMPM